MYKLNQPAAKQLKQKLLDECLPKTAMPTSQTISQELHHGNFCTVINLVKSEEEKDNHDPLVGNNPQNMTLKQSRTSLPRYSSHRSIKSRPLLRSGVSRLSIQTKSEKTEH